MSSKPQSVPQVMKRDSEVCPRDAISSRSPASMKVDIFPQFQLLLAINCTRNGQRLP